MYILNTDADATNELGLHASMLLWLCMVLNESQVEMTDLNLFLRRWGRERNEMRWRTEKRIQPWNLETKNYSEGWGCFVRMGSVIIEQWRMINFTLPFNWIICLRMDFFTIFYFSFLTGIRPHADTNITFLFLLILIMSVSSLRDNRYSGFYFNIFLNFFLLDTRLSIFRPGGRRNDRHQDAHQDWDNAVLINFSLRYFIHNYLNKWRCLLLYLNCNSHNPVVVLNM